MYLFKIKVSIGGINNVVNITMITMIEKIESEIIPKFFPIIAKIKPTSPLGTIPKPTKVLLTLPAINPETIFPMIAIAVNPNA